MKFENGLIYSSPLNILKFIIYYLLKLEKLLLNFQPVCSMLGTFTPKKFEHFLFLQMKKIFNEILKY